MDESSDDDDDSEEEEDGDDDDEDDDDADSKGSDGSEKENINRSDSVRGTQPPRLRPGQHIARDAKDSESKEEKHYK